MFGVVNSSDFEFGLNSHMQIRLHIGQTNNYKKVWFRATSLLECLFTTMFLVTYIVL